MTTIPIRSNVVCVIVLMGAMLISSVTAIHQHDRLTQLSSHIHQHQQQHHNQQSQRSAPWLKNPFIFGTSRNLAAELAEQNNKAPSNLKAIAQTVDNLRDPDPKAWSGIEPKIIGVMTPEEISSSKNRFAAFTKAIQRRSTDNRKGFTSDMRAELLKLLTTGNTLIESALNDKKLFNAQDVKLKGTATAAGIKWKKNAKLSDLKPNKIAASVVILIRATNDYVYNTALSAILTKQKEPSFVAVKELGFEKSIEPNLNRQQDKLIPGAPGSPVCTAAGRSTLGVCLESTNIAKWNRRDKFITTWHGYAQNGAEVRYGAWMFNWRIGAIEAQQHTTADWDRVQLTGSFACDCGGATANAFNNALDVELEMLIDNIFGVVPALSTVGSTSGALTPGFSNDFSFYEHTVGVNGWPAGTTNVVPGGTSMWLFHTSLVTAPGDSGGPLVYNGQVIGILKGDNGANDIWTPIWNIPIPVGYAIC